MPLATFPLIVRLPLLNRELTNITEWEIDSGYLTSTDAFSFTLFDADRSLMKGLEMQPVELVLGDAVQLVGRIDRTSIGDAGRGTALVCQGRDYMADLVECCVDPTFAIKQGQTLKKVIEAVASPVGITKVSDNSDVFAQEQRAGVKLKGASSKPFGDRKVENVKAEHGQGIYEFANRLAARCGATLQPTAKRTEIVLSTPVYDAEPLFSLFRTLDPGASSMSPLLSAQAERDFSSFPSFTLFTGSQGREGEAVKSTTKTLSSVELATNAELERIFGYGITGSRRKPLENGETLGEGRLYRLLCRRDQDARTQEQIDAGLKRAVAERLKDTLIYTCRVPGHQDPQSNAFWQTDMLVQVDDEVTDVHETLWVSSRKFSFSEKGGATTALSMWRPGSFVI